MTFWYFFRSKVINWHEVNQLNDNQKVIDPGAETTSRVVVSGEFLMKRHSAVRMRP
jgi:hypothetical protein